MSRPANLQMLHSDCATFFVVSEKLYDMLLQRDGLLFFSLTNHLAARLVFWDWFARIDAGTWRTDLIYTHVFRLQGEAALSVWDTTMLIGVSPLAALAIFRVDMCYLAAVFLWSPRRFSDSNF